MMSKKVITSPAERAKRKALLVTKIQVERELICLQAQRIANDVKPSTIRDNLLTSAVLKFQNTNFSHSLFGYIERHPRVIWLVSQLLAGGVKKSSSSRFSLLRPLVVGAASWFVANRTSSKRKDSNYANRSFKATKVRAQSKPIRYIDDYERPISSSVEQVAPRKKVTRRRIYRNRL